MLRSQLFRKSRQGRPARVPEETNHERFQLIPLQPPGWCCHQRPHRQRSAGGTAHRPLCETDRLPAEVDLAAELGVSRTVIRDALSEMERAGYIERVRGIGTVVNRSVLNLRSRLDRSLEYYPLIRSFGSYPHADGIQIYPSAQAKSWPVIWPSSPATMSSASRSASSPTPPPSSTPSTTCPAPCLGTGTTPASTCRVTYSMFWSGSAASRWPPMWPTSRQLRRRAHPGRHASGPGRGHASAG